MIINQTTTAQPVVSLSREHPAILAVNPTEVIQVRGNYDDAFDLCLAASEEFGWFNRSTGYNPFTREGKKVCAFEIWESLDGRAPDRARPRLPPAPRRNPHPCQSNRRTPTPARFRGD